MESRRTSLQIHSIGTAFQHDLHGIFHIHPYNAGTIPHLSQLRPSEGSNRVFVHLTSRTFHPAQHQAAGTHCVVLFPMFLPQPHAFGWFWFYLATAEFFLFYPVSGRMVWILLQVPLHQAQSALPLSDFLRQAESQQPFLLEPSLQSEVLPDFHRHRHTKANLFQFRPCFFLLTSGNTPYTSQMLHLHPYSRYSRAAFLQMRLLTYLPNPLSRVFYHPWLKANRSFHEKEYPLQRKDATFHFPHARQAFYTLYFSFVQSACTGTPSRFAWSNP